MGMSERFDDIIAGLVSKIAGLRFNGPPKTALQLQAIQVRLTPSTRGYGATGRASGSTVIAARAWFVLASNGCAISPPRD